MITSKNPTKFKGKYSQNHSLFSDLYQIRSPMDGELR